MISNRESTHWHKIAPIFRPIVTEVFVCFVCACLCERRALQQIRRSSLSTMYCSGNLQRQLREVRRASRLAVHSTTCVQHMLQLRVEILCLRGTVREKKNRGVENSKDTRLTSTHVCSRVVFTIQVRRYGQCLLLKLLCSFTSNS